MIMMLFLLNNFIVVSAIIYKQSTLSISDRVLFFYKFYYILNTAVERGANYLRHIVVVLFDVGIYKIKYTGNTLTKCIR